MNLCINLRERIGQLEEKVGNLLKDQNKAGNKNSLNPRFVDIENNIKGLYLKMERLAYNADTHMEELVNPKALTERVSNIEGWRIMTVNSLNNRVIPAVAKLQRQFQGMQKRIDSQSRYIGHNKHVYDNDGQNLTIMTECLAGVDGSNNYIERNEQVTLNTENYKEDNTGFAKGNQVNKQCQRGNSTSCFFNSKNKKTK